MFMEYKGRLFKDAPAAAHTPYEERRRDAYELLRRTECWKNEYTMGELDCLGEELGSYLREITEKAAGYADDIRAGKMPEEVQGSRRFKDFSDGLYDIAARDEYWSERAIEEMNDLLMSGLDFLLREKEELRGSIKFRETAQRCCREFREWGKSWRMTDIADAALLDAEDLIRARWYPVADGIAAYTAAVKGLMADGKVTFGCLYDTVCRFDIVVSEDYDDQIKANKRYLNQINAMRKLPRQDDAWFDPIFCGEEA